MTAAFDEVTTLDRISEDEHRLIVPDGWQQGRGAFGGLVLGILARAMQTREAESARLLRTFSGEICGPVLPGETSIRSRVIRRGNNQTNLAATLEQEGAILAQATTVLASARKIRSPPLFAFPAPRPPPYVDVQAFAPDPSFGPRFAQHYEFRPTSPLPFAGGTEPIVEGWVRERAVVGRVTASVVLARLDAYWPGIFSIEKAPRPCATTSFLAELLCDPGALDPATPLFYRARTIAQADGYFVELRELWDGEKVVALNQQSFAMLG